MKKTKKPIAKKTKSATRKKPLKRLPVAHSSKPVLKRLRLLEHAHTGSIVNRKNTSHASLFVILIIIGLFLFAIGGFSSAYSTGGTVNVGLTVMGPPPESGVRILIPYNEQTFFDKNSIEVSGTCQPQAFVVIRNNGATVGSCDCENDGTFSLNIQIDDGENKLTALNYDNYNQAGPITESVAVFLSRKNSEALKPGIVKWHPQTPENPAKVPGTDNNISCSNYDDSNLKIGGDPRVEVVCLPRLFFPSMSMELGILVWGGNPPYAVSVDLGSEYIDPVLISMSKPGYKTISLNYSMPDVYRISIKMTDHDHKESFVETSIRVSGVVVDDSDKTTKEGVIQTVVGSGLLNTPVPFYLLALALTFGFWGGDLFDRKFGSVSKPKTRTT